MVSINRIKHSTDANAAPSAVDAPKIATPASALERSSADGLELAASTQPAPRETALSKPLVSASLIGTVASVRPPALGHSDMQTSLEVLRHLLRAENLTHADDAHISASVDAAFASEFAILLTADTNVRSGKDELARSKKGVMAAIWMHKGDYAAFTEGQPKPVKLSQASFDDARRYLGMHAMSESQILTLCCAVAANDLGKSVGWTAGIAKALGDSNLVREDHDVVLEAAARAGLVPCFEQLASLDKQLIIDGLKMGSEFNAPAWLQGEAPAGTLRGALHMQGLPEAYRLKTQEIYQDVAGANLMNKGAFMLEPMSRAFIKGFKVLDGVIAGEVSIKEAYTKPFEERAAALVAQGFVKHGQSAASHQNLSVAHPEDLALLRLLSMGRVIPLGANDTLSKVKLFDEAFNSLPHGVRTKLIEGLTVLGIDDGQAIFPSMAPEMFVQALGKLSKLESHQQQVEGLQVVMTVLSRALRGTKPHVGQTGQVTLQDLRPLLPAVRDEGFAHNTQLLRDAADKMFTQR